MNYLYMFLSSCNIYDMRFHVFIARQGLKYSGHSSLNLLRHFSLIRLLYMKEFSVIVMDCTKYMNIIR